MVGWSGWKITNFSRQIKKIFEPCKFGVYTTPKQHVPCVYACVCVCTHAQCAKAVYYRQTE